MVVISGGENFLSALVFPCERTFLIQTACAVKLHFDQFPQALLLLCVVQHLSLHQVRW